MSMLSATILAATLLGADPLAATSAMPLTTVEEPSAKAWIAGSDECSPGIGCPDMCGSSRGCVRPSCGCLFCKVRRHDCCLWGDDEEECDADCDLCCWDRHLIHYCIGPGDFHPHYPYPPACHGYYYFRPYNHEHVFRDAELAGQMGGDPRAPYSVEHLKGHFPPAPIETPHRPPAADRLPRLEDLLSSDARME